MSAVDPQSVPRQLGPYEVIRQLGAGGMAEVHLARRFGASGWEKIVALKLLRPEHRGHPELERLLISEARLGARFAHPGLVHVHDFGLAGAPGLAGAIYYVCMDYVDGGDLAALLGGRRMPTALALFVGEQLASALAYVHALTDEEGRPLGLVHRDVSPANVLVSRSGEVKLSDFGIAKATAEGDRTWGRLRKGKYAYMAPEQITGEPLTGAADVFALGVMLHECLLGRRPFDGQGPLELMESIRLARLPDDHDFEGLELELQGLLRGSFARDPLARLPGGAAAMARGLARCRRHYEPVGAIDLAGWIDWDDSGDGGSELGAPQEAESLPDGAAGLETLGMDE
jgi:eukaryotic-like serine/threonine-protein kinase